MLRLLSYCMVSQVKYTMTPRLSITWSHRPWMLRTDCCLAHHHYSSRTPQPWYLGSWLTCLNQQQSTSGDHLLHRFRGKRSREKDRSYCQLEAERSRLRHLLWQVEYWTCNCENLGSALLWKEDAVGRWIYLRLESFNHVDKVFREKDLAYVCDTAALICPIFNYRTTLVYH